MLHKNLQVGQLNYDPLHHYAETKGKTMEELISETINKFHKQSCKKEKHIINDTKKDLSKIT